MGGIRDESEIPLPAWASDLSGAASGAPREEGDETARAPASANGGSGPISAHELDLGVDRRSSPRHAITLRVDYKRMNTFFADYAKNISKGGTFIRTGKPLDVGTEFIFVLSIPGQPDQLQLRGEVIWTVDESRSTDEQPSGMGIRFNFVDDSERRRLEDFVAKLMSDKLGSHVATKLLGRSA